jgi:hypothetical protein
MGFWLILPSDPIAEVDDRAQGSLHEEARALHLQTSTGPRCDDKNFINWLVVWNMNFMTFHILGISSSQLANIFQRG